MRYYFLWLTLCVSIIFSAMVYANENGKFKLYFDTPKDEDYQNIEIVVKASNQFQNIIEGLNREFILPEDIFVKFSIKDGPVYYPKNKTIVMSYPFIAYLSGLYVNKYPKASSHAMVNFSIRATTFFFYHEMAHALINVLDLPIVSNEETAADNLAVIIALEYTNDGYDIVMDSAELFDILDHTTQTYAEDDLWDEHALNSQRFYNIICLTYGRDPDKVLAELKNTKLLKFIKEKSAFCKDEYASQLQAWLKLLDPFFQSH
ncbi:MAG: DUF4344 domain-containing metallopeptidase [Gammaproteobacteria bacterium]|nr:DUF4344 domain-containing metallopeptidase [Gammaproteobacteria bacterium]